MVVVALVPGFKDGVVCFLLAELDLLLVSEIVRDPFFLVAVLPNFVQIRNLHVLQAWGHIVYKFEHGIVGLVFQGFASVKGVVVDCLQVGKVSQLRLGYHLGGHLLGQVKAFRH